MRGYVLPGDRWGNSEENLTSWESLVVNAVGATIEFWGFKRNQGRVWALLYLRALPMDAAMIREQLELSKGAVSMILRELESWGVIQRVRLPDSQAWHFLAEIDLMSMVTRVFREREVHVVSRVREDLSEAVRLARQDPEADEDTVQRIERMSQLAGLVEQALKLFMKTAQIDVSEMKGILRRPSSRSASDETVDEE